MGPDILKILNKKIGKSEEIPVIFKELKGLAMILQREALKKFTELNNTESKKMAKYVKDNTILDWREYGDDFG